MCFGRYYFFKEDDLRENTTLGSGPGGQATNRRKQTVILKHNPSGIIIRFSRFPSLWCNRRAARELLNLRLEEKLLGEESRLGQLKAMKERRSRRRQRQIDRLLAKSNAAKLQRSTQNDYLSFLKGLKPLPPEAVAQIEPTCRTFSGQNFFISTLFGAECNNWWPILQGAFSRANMSFSQDGITVGSSTTNFVFLPLLFEYLFPLPTVSSNEESCHSDNLQLERCRHDMVALVNVQRAFRCFCELFGLRLKELASVDSLPGVALVTDGANWLELKARMADPLDGRPTAFARVAWPRVYFSLRALKLIPEATSVKTFFRREVRKHGSNWAKEILKTISRGI
ncbi:unnamed protein product [Phytomonas sp. EM1]|nr:unnamed protein product [Phytomonas sp. EM1]|eukprot:CCW61499.1 unnamed protein product [Phytomonas sp. isolate EM1]